MIGWKNITYKLRTPDGTAMISIAEDKGEIVYISFQIGKAGSSINAYCYAIANLVVELIKSKGIGAALELLSNISSDKAVRYNTGVLCRSGVEALYIALLGYKKDMDKEVITYNPPKFARLG